MESPNLRMRAIVLPNTKFTLHITLHSFYRSLVNKDEYKYCLNRTIRSRVIAKNDFQYGVASAILIFGISEFLSCFRCLGQKRLCNKFRQIRTIRG